MRVNSEALATSLQPVSWLSFLLLLVTGGGIIVYYDKEKKRHIEGRLLW
jgi:protein SCO1/2